MSVPSHPCDARLQKQCLCTPDPQPDPPVRAAFSYPSRTVRAHDTISFLLAGKMLQLMPLWHCRLCNVWLSSWCCCWLGSWCCWLSSCFCCCCLANTIDATQTLKHRADEVMAGLPSSAICIAVIQLEVVQQSMNSPSD